ncbi:MFS transporter [Taklimakanibacter lacteus]|uniref:MFS transporter n=1 Tax=Taklimakanibacter lacteus TaxID=2268456 RepID=UPI000E671C6A
MTDARRTIFFVNAAHALVHYVVLIFPTAVIVIGTEWMLGYGELIPLATGCFVAFGLLSLPAGWLVNVTGPDRLLASFFILTGLACLFVAAATTWTMLGLALLLLGAAGAIYHPVGLSLLASRSQQLGRDFAVNGVCGNVGAAVAAAGTAFLASVFGWRAAFIGPGAVALMLGILFIATTRHSGNSDRAPTSTTASPGIAVQKPLLAVGMILLAGFAGGMTYNIITVALPKIVDERFDGDLPLIGTGALATVVFICGALMQLATGRLIDRFALASLFVGLAALELTGLVLAWLSTGPLLLIGLAFTMAAIYGLVVVDDAIVARFVPEHLRAKAYGITYSLSFAVSAAAIPMMGMLHDRGAGFAPVLALTAACSGAMLICALGFHHAVKK